MQTRREFLAGGLAWPAFFSPRTARIAGVPFTVKRKRGTKHRHFFWVHGSEPTARDVLLAHMERNGGKALLTRSHVRYIVVEGGRLDPNRMFSRVGAEANLRSLNPDWTPDRLTRALDLLDRDRARFLHQLLPPSPRLLIALHNNSGGYSLLDEIPISDKVSAPRRDAPHEFMLCTSPQDYDALSTSPFNVVLQNVAPPQDDGSLSRLAAVRNVRYVNIEAALGNSDGQRAMLEWADRHLP